MFASVHQCAHHHAHIGTIVALTIMPSVVCVVARAGAHTPQDCTQVEECVAVDTTLLQTGYKGIPAHGADIPSRTIPFHDDMLIARVDANASSDVNMAAERKKERKNGRGDIAYNEPREKGKHLRFLAADAPKQEVLGREFVPSQQELSLDARLAHDKYQRMDGQDEWCRDQHWLFILSAGRSGSTSILEMVNVIPGYFLGGENGGIMSHFLSLWRLRQEQKQYHHATAWAAAGETSDQTLLCDLKAYVRDIIGSPAVGKPMPTTLGFKEIRHTEKEELDMFVRMFPNAKFIINTRNASEQATSGFLASTASEAEVAKWNKELREWGRKHSEITFLLPLEEFAVARFNELLVFLGVVNCRYTQVAHTNEDDTYTQDTFARDPSTLPGIACV